MTTTPDWLQVGGKVARVATSPARGHDVATPVTVVRLTATQVVVKVPTSHEEERYRLKDLRKVGDRDAWRPAPRLADPASDEVAAIRARARRERARAKVSTAATALKAASGEAVAAELDAIGALRRALTALETELSS